MSDVRAVAPVIVLLDRERPLILNMAALRQAELRLRALTGDRDLSIFTLVGEIGLRTRSVGLTELSVLLWAGLSRVDATVTDEQVLELLTTPERIGAAVHALITALTTHFTAKPADGDGARPLPTSAPSTGSISGRSPAATSDSPPASSGA